MPLQLIETNVKCPKEMIPFMKFFRCKYTAHMEGRGVEKTLLHQIYMLQLFGCSPLQKNQAQSQILDTSIYFNALAASMLRCLLPMSGIFMSL